MSTLNVTLELESLIATLSLTVPEFRHIDPSRVMACVAGTRGGGVQGMYAKIHPLRFENGSRTALLRRRRGKVLCEIAPLNRSGVEILYVVYFLSPRFFNLPFREKMITIFHELYHISPAFDGDIRRLPGKNYAHGSSRKKYNAAIETLVDNYLEQLDDVAHLGFLEGDLASLRCRYNSLVGRKMAVPKLRVVKPEAG